MPVSRHQALAAATKRLVYVNISGNAVTMPWKSKVPAIVQGWFIGSEAGHALAAVLTGDVNPSGKLPFTWPASLQDVGAHALDTYPGTWRADKKVIDEEYKEGIYVGYRYYETRYEDTVLGTANVGDFDYASTVAYPFGYGLSYSDLSYDNLTMKEDGGQLVFTVDVKNPSSVDARDAVLIYMQSPYTDYDKQNGIEKAAVELVGYTKIDVPAGKTASATVIVDKSELRERSA